MPRFKGTHIQCCEETWRGTIKLKKFLILLELNWKMASFKGAKTVNWNVWVVHLILLYGQFNWVSNFPLPCLSWICPILNRGIQVLVLHALRIMYPRNQNWTQPLDNICLFIYSLSSISWCFVWAGGLIAPHRVCYSQSPWQPSIWKKPIAKSVPKFLVKCIFQNPKYWYLEY